MMKLNDEIFEHIATGLVYLDKDYRLVEYNRLGLASLGANDSLDLTGTNLFEISDQNDFKEIGNALQEVCVTKSLYQLVGCSVIPYGKQEEAFWDYSINTHNNGFLLAATDATDRVSKEKESNKEKEQEIENLKEKIKDYDRLKSEFVANVSHELRTPLTAIIGFAQLMRGSIQRGADSPLTVADGLERILKNGKHLLAMIDDVLDLARLEAGITETGSEQFSLVKTVTEVFRSLEKTAADKGLDYELKVQDTDFPQVSGDYSRVSQIIRNLLSNSVKFTEEGSVKAFLSKENTEEWRLEITDTGIGIAPENLNMVFENFRQVDGSASRLFGGFGLGLPLAKRLAELLGGKILLESEYGKGSKFTLIMPFKFKSNVSGN